MDDKKKIGRFELSLDKYVEGITSGDITVLSKAITLVESTLPKHQELSREIIKRCLEHTGNSIRIGITGVPGVGKSTFIEVFGLYLTETIRKKVAVLAVDPTSQVSKGSILGDKVRMENLSKAPNAYIRPTPTSGTLGGVSRKTRESILLCEAAGFEIVIVETVGVGQSEIAVHSMVDFFLLLLLADAGDEIQGMKRGIMEMADSIVITKADGSNKEQAELARKEFARALKLFPQNKSGWEPKVLTCSSIEKTGIDQIWKLIEEFYSQMSQSGYIRENRRQQSKFWMHETISSMLEESFYKNDEVTKNLVKIEKKVLEGEIDYFTAAEKLFDLYFN